MDDGGFHEATHHQSTEQKHVLAASCPSFTSTFLLHFFFFFTFLLRFFFLLDLLEKARLVLVSPNEQFRDTPESFNNQHLVPFIYHWVPHKLLMQVSVNTHTHNNNHKKIDERRKE